MFKITETRLRIRADQPVHRMQTGISMPSGRPVTIKAASRCLLLLVTAVFVRAGNAGTFEPSQKDFYVYPPYCKAKMADLPENRKHVWRNKFPVDEQQVAFWKRQLGPDWYDLEQYCAGLTHISRANDIGWLRSNKESAAAEFRAAAAAINQARLRSAPRNPFWQELSLRYAEAIGGAGQYAEAMKVLQDVTALNPKNTNAYVLQARLTARRGDLNAAIAQLEAGLAAGAGRGPILYYLASDYYELGDYKRAREYAQQAEQAGMKMDNLKSRLPDE
jgi:tetratricopeptide (TPR) repeat protein